MGILNALGLMTRAEHDKIVANKDRLIAQADFQMKGEDFDGVDDHVGRVALIMARLRAARSRLDKADLASPRAKTEAEQKLSEAQHDIGKLKENYEARGATINDLLAEIAALKPDAEAMRARRANDRKRVRPSRAKAKAASDTVKTGAATGKPRTGIPAKVGGGAAKLSGDRPAKKAVR